MSEAIFINTDRPVYTEEEIMDYDVAQDLIDYVIAIYSEKIYYARLGKDSDDDLVKSLLAEQGKHIDAGMDLRLKDRDGVKKAIEHYRKILREYDKEECR